MKMLMATMAEPAIAATIATTLNVDIWRTFAPRVMATEIDPGPTVKGRVRG